MMEVRRGSHASLLHPTAPSRPLSDWEIAGKDFYFCLVQLVACLSPFSTPTRLATSASVLCIFGLVLILLSGSKEVANEVYYGVPGKRSYEGQPVDDFVSEAEIETNGRMDLVKAAKLWDQKIGCAAFRKKHRRSIDKFRDLRRWPYNPSLQDPGKPSCGRMKLRHIIIQVPPEAASWMFPGNLEGFHFCPRCELTCQISWQPSMATFPDASLFVAPAIPPAERRKGEPMRIYVAIGPGGTALKNHLAKYDIQVGLKKTSDLQITMASFGDTLKSGRYHAAQQDKLEEPSMLWYDEGECSVGASQREGRGFMSVMAVHAFGKCRDNFNVSLQAPFHSLCKNLRHVYQREEELVHCAMSHYKFSLVVDHPRAEGSVSEKIYAALEAGSVPLYYGAPDIENFMPPESFIDGSKFATIQEVAGLISVLKSNPLEYMNFFAWRFCGIYGNFGHAERLGIRDLPCRLCEMVSAKGGRLFKS